MEDPIQAVPKPTRPLAILPTRALFMTNPSPNSNRSISVISCCYVGIFRCSLNNRNTSTIREKYITYIYFRDAKVMKM